jgi:ABC-type transport system involved in multi-copper enzyme maturation permease subunit
MKIIGIQDFEKAEKIKEQFILKNEEENEIIRKENIKFIIFVIVLTIILGLILTICWFLFARENIALLLMIIFVMLCFIIFSMLCTDHYNYINDISEYPPVYQYAFYTKDKNVLHYEKIKIENKVWLQLHLEDVNTKIVSYEKVGPFEVEERTDINEELFDLTSEYLYKPYHVSNALKNNDT